MTDEVNIPIVKMGVTVPMSRERYEEAVPFRGLMDAAMARMFQPDTRSEAEKAAAREAWAKECAAKMAKVFAEHAVVLAAANPVLRPILELHAPVPNHDVYPTNPRCEGCDMNGYEAEPPEFPCRTYELASGNSTS